MDLQSSAPVTKTKAARSTKAPAVQVEQVRVWGDVVGRIRELLGQGVTVPQIAQELQVAPVLVQQVGQQSYKMAISTLEVFDRQERARCEQAGV